MASVGSSDNLNILVQWRKHGSNDLWRYKIDKNKASLEQQIKQNSYFYDNDVIDFVRWSAKNYAAKHYALIFWNHGSGVLDPSWESLNQLFLSYKHNPLSYRYNPRTSMLPALTKGSCMHRGIMFDEKNKMYISNKKLSDILGSITTDVLKKKLDVFGMDACFMQMMGVIYPIRHYAKYCVASEEVELAHGWNYKQFLATLAEDEITPLQLAKNIVSTYEQFYKNKTHLYTQSAVKLDELDYLKENINLFVDAITKCCEIDKTNTKHAIFVARKRCVQFSSPQYIDLHSFYKELILQLDKLNNKTTAKQLRTSNDFENLKTQLINGTKIIEAIVVSQTASKRFQKTNGISIYFPRGQINNSYVITDFARDSRWLEFLKHILEKKVV